MNQRLRDLRPKSRKPRAAAAEIVMTISDRLTDTERVVAIASGERNTIALGRNGWSGLSLSDGYPGIALLFAELGRTDEQHLHTAYELISSAAALPLWTPGTPALYSGAVSLGYAAHVAAGGSDSYQRLLRTVDDALCDAVPGMVEANVRPIADGAPVDSFGCYDLIKGITGIGRYLLIRYRRSGRAALGTALAEVLRLLVTISVAKDIRVAGVAVPVWWVRHGVSYATTQPQHVNLGTAHGIAGPLALLALAYRAGIRVPGQAEAIAAIVAILLRWHARDESGPFWPYLADLADHRDRSRAARRDRDAWCYGSIGTGRALQLAGNALDRPEWTELGWAALRAAMSGAATRISDASICHGWAGVMQTLRVAAADGSDDQQDWLPAAIESAAARTVAAFDARAPFGYRYALGAGQAADRPGFLEGSAGIALALHGFATDQPPSVDWDAALLVG